MDGCHFVYRGRVLDNLDDIINIFSEKLEENRDNIINEARNVYNSLIKITSKQYTNHDINFNINKEDIENTYFNMQNQPISFEIYSDLRNLKEQLSYIEIVPSNSEECQDRLREYIDKVNQLITRFTTYRNIGILKAALENNMDKMDLINFLNSIGVYVNGELEKINSYLSEVTKKKVYNLLRRRKYQLEMFWNVDDYLGFRYTLEMLAVLLSLS